MGGNDIPSVVCLGEVLWDVFPERRLLGGAPFNVACHLKALGMDAHIVSRVGMDHLGEEILAEVRSRGLRDDTVQRDPDLPTGRVLVTLDKHGKPVFSIEAPAAWDSILPDARSLELVRQARAVVFGSLAHRREPSRSTLRALLRTPALKVFDVNLRPPHDCREVVEYLLHVSNLVKLNDAELERLASWYELRGGMRDQAAQLARTYGLDGVCITRGENGAVLWYRGTWSEHAGYRVEVVDTVGSGDAFLAALLWGLLRGANPSRALAYGNAAGAYVAARPGATPPLDPDAITHMAGD